MNRQSRRHHFVPQFWIRGFVNNQNQLYGRDERGVHIVSPKEIMQLEWLHTLYSPNWEPSDDLETRLGAIETDAAALFRRLNDAAEALT